MSDAAVVNIAKYKSGMNNTKKTFVKHTPFKIVQGYSTEQLASIGTADTKYPTPVNASKQVK